MGLSDDCVHLPHWKDTAGKYSVFGEAVLAPRGVGDTRYEMFSTCIPLLKLAEGKIAVMLGPLSRDLDTICCGDTEHVRDQQTAGHRVAMRDAVAKALVDLERLPVDEWLEVL
jgi:hypothetical protein